MRYTTSTDAYNQVLIPALGEYVDDFDHEAIFSEVFDYRIDEDEAGNKLLHTAGYEDITTPEEFWEIVAKHDLTA